MGRLRAGGVIFKLLHPQKSLIYQGFGGIGCSRCSRFREKIKIIVYRGSIRDDT